MEISINQSLLAQHPELKIGIIHYTKIVVAESPQMIKGRMQLYQENLFLEMQNHPVTQYEGILEWRQLWKKLGADPNRYRHSAESLMRRISKQNYLTPFHSGVDLNNFFSLQYETPIGLYDIAQIKGFVDIALGHDEIGYDGLNGRFNTLTNILYSYDEIGAFGSPFVDSKRTAVTEETTEALHIFYLRPSLTTESANELLASAGKMFNQIHGGHYQIALLSNDAPSTTL
ncbi:B3/4 domain-containing protein [Lysinibacillus cavernae]|uniref:B3/B4 domain-containing protein n=1 Tax=Lysinibacillus cavernae TaxID=2666135 RepID=UPI0012D92A7B|nr:phenylalanine--tRNA ligase beta subunit-related protein [Lysinibacillus cavernae]